MILEEGGPVLLTESTGDAGEVLRADSTDTAQDETADTGADVTETTGKLSFIILTADTTGREDTRARATLLARPLLIHTTAEKEGGTETGDEEKTPPTRKLLQKLTLISENIPI